MTSLAIVLAPAFALGGTLPSDASPVPPFRALPPIVTHGPSAAVASDTLRITVLYDNTTADPRLAADWGFAALIEHQGHTLLLDAGGDPGVLLSNLDSLAIDPRRIEAVAVSHAHGDHAGGLEGLLERGVSVPLYALPSFPLAVREQLAQAFAIADASAGQELIPGVFTTGEMVDPAVGIPEQALVVPTDSGLVVITGCAHQGVLAIVRRAMEMFGAPVYLIVGGFHMLDRSAPQVQQIIAEFRRLGVRRVGATHCTGDEAIAAFAAAYGADLVRVGAGRVLLVGG